MACRLGTGKSLTFFTMCSRRGITFKTMFYSVFPRTEVLTLTTNSVFLVVSQHGVAEVDSTLREVVLALENKIQALEKENKHLSKS